jgi:L-Ala-D/L-Glu epimerase
MGLMDRIVSIAARHKSLALREPFETARRRALVSDTVFVEIATKGGTRGLGAATPVQYVTEETAQSVVDAVNLAAPALVGCSIADFRRPFSVVGETLPDSPSARAGVEMAILDAAGKLAGVPSYALLGGKPRKIETDVTIAVVPPDHAGELAREAAARGFTQFKMKASGKNPAEDLARAVAISRAVPGSSLAVDANQGFEPQGAVDFARSLLAAGVNVRLYEQPVDRGDLDGLAEVSGSLDIPVFADESALCPEDVSALIELGAVSGVNVKLMKMGISGALRVSEICKSAGLRMMLGCMLEPRVGIAMALHLACAVAGFEHFDLDADLLLVDQSPGGFVRDGAWIEPVTAPGLGCPFAASDSDRA